MLVTEVDPICALQAAMDGLQVVTLEDVVDTADIFITTTGNKDIIMADHMAQMKHQAIVGNIGHFDNEIDMAGLAKMPGIEKVKVKPQVARVGLPGRPRDHRAVRGPAAEPRQRDRPPELRDVASFSNQVIAQIEVHKNPDAYVSTARRSTRCPSTSTRRSLGCTWTRSAPS